MVNFRHVLPLLNVWYFILFACLFVCCVCVTEIDGASAYNSIFLQSRPCDGALCGWRLKRPKRILKIWMALTWKSRRTGAARCCFLHTLRTLCSEPAKGAHRRTLAGTPEGGQTMQHRSNDALPTVNTEASQTRLHTACILGRLISFSLSSQDVRAVGEAVRCASA